MFERVKILSKLLARKDDDWRIDSFNLVHAPTRCGFWIANGVFFLSFYMHLDASMVNACHVLSGEEQKLRFYEKLLLYPRVWKLLRYKRAQNTSREGIKRDAGMMKIVEYLKK